MLSKHQFYATPDNEVRPVLDGMSNTDLVTLFNTITGGKIRKFASKEDGLRRLWRERREHHTPNTVATQPANGPAPAVKIAAIGRLCAQGEKMGATRTVDAKIKAVVTLVGPDAADVSKTRPTAVCFADSAVARQFERLAQEVGAQGLLDGMSYAPVNSTPEQPKGQVERPMPKVTKPTRKEGDDVTVVRLKTTINPKKTGTKAFDRFELYVDGMSVAKALAAGLTREDLRWDSTHGHIALETA